LVGLHSLLLAIGGKRVGGGGFRSFRRRGHPKIGAANLLLGITLLCNGGGVRSLRCA
jgi:hypothetical protein